MNIAVLSGFLCLALSAWLTWIQPTITRSAAGPQLGKIALGLGVLGILAWLCKAYRLAALGGVAGGSLCSYALLHLTFKQPALWSMVDENAQYAQIMRFSQTSLIPNRGLEPTLELALMTETVVDRLAAALYFASWGWWFCLLGSLLVLVGCCTRDGARVLRWATGMAVVLAMAQGKTLVDGFWAQYQQRNGALHMAHGRYAAAIHSYETAQRIDPQLARSALVHRQLGEAYYHLGSFWHPQARFYLGYRAAAEGKTETAIAAFLVAAQEATPPLREVVHKRLAWTYVNLGLTQYQEGHVNFKSSQQKKALTADPAHVDLAISQWEKALAADPAQVQAMYFLSRAYFERSRYQQSIALSRMLLALSRNRLLNANVQSNLGDTYWKLLDFTNARAAYEASLKLDAYLNFRVLKQLGGT